MSEPSILRISEAASLAMHTMVLLAASQKRLSARDMAARLGVSEAHLSKVLQRLAKAGLVDSVRGRNGGFRLVRPRNRVALLHVYEAIEGKLPQSRCLMGDPVCSGRHCILGGLLEMIDTWVRAYLSGTRLSQLTDVYPDDARAEDA